MNTVSLAMVTLVLGIDVGWQPLDDGGLEYIIQIEPQLLATLGDGQDIVSDLPPDLEGVRTCRVTVGTGRVPRVANRPNTAVGTEAARQPPSAYQPYNQPYNQGVLNLPPPPTDFAPANQGVLNLPPPPIDDLPSRPTRSPQSPVRQSAPPPSNVGPSRAAPVQTRPPVTADPLVAPPGNYANPSAPTNRTRSAPPAQSPERFADQVPVPAAAPIPVEAPEPQNIEKVYQLAILNARLPSGTSSVVIEEGPELGPVPRTVEQPIVATTGAPPAADDVVASTTAEAKPWGWLLLSLLALSISVGLNFFLGWVNWGFRQRYETLLDRFQSTRARTA